MIMNKTEQLSDLEIDLNEFDKDTLIYLISFANERNITFSKAIELILTEFLSKYDPSKKINE